MRKSYIIGASGSHTFLSSVECALRQLSLVGIPLIISCATLPAFGQAASPSAAVSPAAGQAATPTTDLPVALFAQQAVLPDGQGREVVQGLCVRCHQTSMIVQSPGHSKNDWHTLISKMITLPTPLDAEVTEYLAKNFPPMAGREPVLVPGNTKVTFKEWLAPTPGQRVRDPLMDADGNIWWAGHWGDIVGKLDPRTGKMTEYKLDAGAGPHNLALDASGNVWYTGNRNGTMGRIDRATGNITVFPMPDRTLDPQTAVFARDGSVWFTMERANKLGRLDPATGKTEILDTPTKQSHPYGIRADSKGMLWIAYKGAYALARLDPRTRTITEFPTPNAGKYTGLPYYIRRVAISSDDMVWYTDSGHGELGRFNPKTGEFKQWPSPSGTDSHPYAIEVVNDIVWYNESNQRPEALVRFDPKTEKFQSWAIPSSVGVIGGVLRNMYATSDGNLLIHQTTSNTVGLVTIH